MKTDILHSIANVPLCPPLASLEFKELLLQLIINVVVLVIISRVVYFRWNRNPEYMFAQLITGLIVFMICALLRWVKLELGLVLGLFAIFAIIRFRTINVPVKEMSYLFMVVGISAVNALLPFGSCLQWVAVSNSLLIALTIILETTCFDRKTSCRSIQIDNPELLHPSRHNLLLKELRDLTGLDIIRYEIGKVDYGKKHAQLRIFFKSNQDTSMQENATANDDD